MKLNPIIVKHAEAAETMAVKKPDTVKEDVAAAVEAPASSDVESLIFPASDRFKHMLTLIARDNKELYNRIVGLD